MIYELLPTSIKLLFIKRKTSLSLQGDLDALRELLEELEYLDETKDSFLYLSTLLDEQEKREEVQCENFIKWILEKIDFLKNHQVTGSNKIKDFIVKTEQSIASGTTSIFQGNNYLEMQLNLLENSSKMFADYGQYEMVHGWCVPLDIDSSIREFNVDPFGDKDIPNIIWPNTPEGDVIEKALGHGFIRIEVSPPHDFQRKRRYHIYQGKISFKYPDEFEEVRCRIKGRVTPEIRDKYPLLLLRELRFYAYWRDTMAVERKFPDNDEEKLKAFYSTMSKQGHLQLAFAIKGVPESLRSQISVTLERFLVFVLQEKQERRFTDKQRAYRYAYGKIKEILILKSFQERNLYTYAEIKERIMNDASQELLSFRVCNENCEDACKDFAKEHDWKPKRRSAQNIRVDPTRW